MANTFNARFFDGNTIQAVEAWVDVVPEGLKISYENKGVKFEINWPQDSLQLMERLYHHKPGVIGHKNMLGARLVITQAELYNAILPLISPKNIKLSHVHHPWRTAWLLVAGAILIIGIPLWQFHTLSMWIANVIPYRWEEKFWNNVVKEEFTKNTECVSPKGRQALDKMVSRLAQAANIKQKIDVRVINAPETVNAESSPAFHIFIYSGLLDMNNPDAVAAVIAHELGHSVNHHVIAKYISIMGMAAFFNAVLTISANNVAFDFINLKYSRDYETQCDLYAIHLLNKAHINPQGFQFAMEYLEKLSGEVHGIEPYLVDHPPHQERIDLMKHSHDAGQTTPSLTSDEWKALKSICTETKPMKF